MRWLWVVLLAGCYSPPAYEACAITCTTAVGCPGDLQCRGGVCRTEAPCNPDAGSDIDAADPNGDIDGDMIPNGIDLCPNKNSPNNNDHDHDMRGDVCDPCPHLSSDLQDNPDADTDQDGVGNGCDPRTQPGDRIDAFVGFYTPAEISGWPNTGSWSVSSGTLTVDALNSGRLDIQTPTMFDPNMTVIAGIDVIALKPSTTVDRYAGLLARFVDGNNYQACHTREQVANLDVRNRIVSSGVPMDATAPFTTTTLGPHVYTFTLLGSNSRCLITQDGLAPKEATRTNAPVPGAMTRVGIEAADAQIAVDYLLVIRSP